MTVTQERHTEPQDKTLSQPGWPHILNKNKSARRDPRHSLSPGNPVCTSRARVNRAPGPKLRVSVRVVWYCEKSLSRPTRGQNILNIREYSRQNIDGPGRI